MHDWMGIGLIALGLGLIVSAARKYRERTTTVLAPGQVCQMTPGRIRPLSDCRQPLYRTWGAASRQIISGLQIDPELGSGVEGLSKQPSSLGRHAAFAPHQLVDSLDRHLQMSCQGHLG